VTRSHRRFMRATTPTPELEGASSIGERYIRASIFSGSAGVLSRLLVGVVPVVLARSLGPSKYGVYAVVTSMVGMASTLTQVGINLALPKFVPEYSRQNRPRGKAILVHGVLFVIVVVTVVCIAIFLSARWIAGYIYHDVGLWTIFRLSAFLVLATSLFNLASSVVAAFQDFRTYGAALALRSLSLLGLAWTGALLLGLRGALGGQLLASVAGLALLAFVGAKLCRQRFDAGSVLFFSWEIAKEIVSLALPAFLVTLLAAPVYWFNDTLLARHAGFSQVGMFNVMFALVQLILLVPNQLSVPGVTFMSEARVEPEHESFNQLVTTNLRAIWAVTLPIALVCALISPVLIRGFFGSAYVAATKIAFVMSLAALLMMLDRVLGQAITASGRMWHRFLLVLGWAATFAVVSVLAVPRLGIVGSAVAFVVSYLIFFGSVGLYCHVQFRVTWQPFRRLATLTAVGFAAGEAIARSHKLIWLYAGSALLVFVVVSFEWLWVFDKPERRTIRFMASRLCRELLSRLANGNQENSPSVPPARVDP